MSLAVRVPASARAVPRAAAPGWVWAAGGLLGFFALWEAAARSGLMKKSLLPAPSALPAAFHGEFVEGIWLDTVLASLGHYGMGLAIGSALGVALGAASGLLPRVEAAQSWVVRVLRPIPGIAWIPFAIIWFGVSQSAAVFIIAIAVFWINYFAALGAVQSVDKDLVEVAQAFGHRGFRARLVKVVLPASLPGVLSGLRTGIGQAWMAVVAAELFGIDGVGQRMMQASGLLNSELVVVYMLTMAALYGAIDAAFVAARDRLLAWQR